jgi:carboxypeptidase-like protein
VAGIYGTLKGKVLDKDGKPVFGATVFLMGTTNGCYVKDTSGKYTVNCIPPGKYTVKVTSYAHKDEFKELTITKDSVTIANFNLKYREIRIEDINFYDPPLMVDHYNIGTVITLSKKEIEMMGGDIWGR